MKKHKEHLLSFLIPIIILTLVMIVNKIYPFGNKILLMLDGYNQYPGFLNSFVNSLNFKQSIFYSFKGLTGFNIYACFVYYSFNITNLLFLLFKTQNIINFYTLIIVFKVGLCSLTMHAFLSYLKKDNINIFFSICYGLTSFNLLYYLNYMWFDSVIIFPLVILGIEKIFKENKYSFYTIFLSLSIIFNFYIGYMICIFSVIYFIYKYIVNKSNKKIIFKFIFYSLISGLISSFALIPVILELLSGKANLFVNYAHDYFKFDLDGLSTFYKLTLGSYSNGDLEYGGPNVYVSLFVYINALLFFFNKKIKLKEKIISTIILFFFLLSMSFNLLDYFWQMMQMPIWYPVRYAFIFDFYLIYLAYKNYICYEFLTLKKNIIVLVILLSFITIGFFTSGNLNDQVNLTAKLIYLSISILFILYYFYFMNSKQFRKYIWIIVIIELTINSFIIFRNNGNINTYNEFINNYQNNSKILERLNLDYFDRVSFEDRTIKNNGLLLNYNDINLFTSVRNQKIYDFLNKQFGFLTIDNCSTNYYFNNPLANTFFAIKYYISKSNINYYKKIDSYDGYNIYLNEDASKLGFLTNTNLLNYNLSDDYVSNINNLVKTINNDNRDILTEINVKEKNIECTSKTCIINGEKAHINYDYVAKKEAFIYIQNDYQTNKDETNYTVKINDILIDFSAKYPLKVNKNDHINIIINPKDNYKDYFYHVYEVDYAVYEEFVHNIKENSLEIIEYKNDGNFKGMINVEDETLLFTNISNDNGWTVYVDNKKVKITPIFDSMIGLKLTKGEHTIEFIYTPPGLKTGEIISLISLLSLLALEFINKKRKIID